MPTIYANLVSYTKPKFNPPVFVASGNGMCDLGARMLSKALQINTRLRMVVWDKNNTTCQGFEDIASALHKSVLETVMNHNKSKLST